MQKFIVGVKLEMFKYKNAFDQKKTTIQMKNEV